MAAHFVAIRSCKVACAAHRFSRAFPEEAKSACNRPVIALQRSNLEERQVSDEFEQAFADGDLGANAEAFVVELERFSGPLDLLLHLIQKHEMNIFDIPVAVITEKYLEYMRVIEELNLDQAGDFLVMAATLAHIKSRMLLPAPEAEALDEEEALDPREELVRRLLEYQRFKAAAEQLAARPMLGRDVFVRPPEKAAAVSDEVDIEDVSVFDLVSVFQDVLERVRLHAPHQIQLDPVHVEDKINQIIARVEAAGRLTFKSLFDEVYNRPELIATFLAILELARLSILRIFQTTGGGEIYIALRPDAPRGEELEKRLALLHGVVRYGNQPDLPGIPSAE